MWQLTLTPTDNQELRQAGFDAQQEQAFICNLQVGRCLPVIWFFELWLWLCLACVLNSCCLPGMCWDRAIVRAAAAGLCLFGCVGLMLFG